MVDPVQVEQAVVAGPLVLQVVQGTTGALVLQVAQGTTVAVLWGMTGTVGVPSQEVYVLVMPVQVLQIGRVMVQGQLVMVRVVAVVTV